MKKMLLLLVFIAFYNANAQITVTITGFATIVFDVRTPPSGTTPASYSTSTGSPYFFLNRNGNTGLNNYWSIWSMPTLTGLPSLLATSSTDTNLEPPCFDTWKMGTGVYRSTTITGVSCTNFPHGGTPAITPLGIIYPIYTSNQLYAMTSPTPGLTVFDISLGKVRTWNGSQWLPI